MVALFVALAILLRRVRPDFRRSGRPHAVRGQDGTERLRQAHGGPLGVGPDHRGGSEGHGAARGPPGSLLCRAFADRELQNCLAAAVGAARGFVISMDGPSADHEPRQPARRRALSSAERHLRGRRRVGKQRLRGLVHWGYENVRATTSSSWSRTPARAALSRAARSFRDRSAAGRFASRPARTWLTDGRSAEPASVARSGPRGDHVSTRAPFRTPACDANQDRRTRVGPVEDERALAPRTLYVQQNVTHAECACGALGQANRVAAVARAARAAGTTYAVDHAPAIDGRVAHRS